MSKEKKKEKKEKSDKKVDPRLEAYHKVLKRQEHLKKKDEVVEPTPVDENVEEEKEETINAQTEPKQEKKQKKPKNKSKKKEQKAEAAKQDEHAALPGKQAALDYLHMWHTNRSSWSFKKNKQNWLIRHMLDPYQIPKEDFKILLQYFTGLEGNSKTFVLEVCKKAKEKIILENGQAKNALDRIRLSRITVLTTMFEKK